MKQVNRRAFLRTALGAAATLSSSGITPGTAWGRVPDAAIESTPLTAKLTLITGAGANVVASSSAEGAVLVDGGLESHSGKLVAAALEATSAKRVVTLFNTHWHPEQSGSNQRLGKSGTKIIAHENTKLWLTRKITVDWRPEAYGPLTAKALPTETFYKTTQVYVGDEPVECGYMTQAHTDGDIYVFFRGANVLVGGGVVSEDRWPLVDFQTGGWIAGLVGGLDTLIAVSNDATRIVPANGSVLTREDLQTQRSMYFTIYERLVKALTKGFGPDEALATEPAKEFKPEWGDPTAFVTRSFKSLWGHMAADA